MVDLSLLNIDLVVDAMLWTHDIDGLPSLEFPAENLGEGNRSHRGVTLDLSSGDYIVKP